MTGGKKLVFIVVFTVVFLIILSAALFSDVSISAGMVRAVTAATLFTVMLWGIFKIISCFILSGIVTTDEIAATNDSIGKTLNITVDDTLSDGQVLKDNIQVVAHAPATGQQFSLDAAVPFEDFAPLATRQIDPQIEKIINNDPKRLAEIVKKMGFDD